MAESNEPTARIPQLVGRLYQVVHELETLFPGRKFTPDGHLVGSLGEVWAAFLYQLDLFEASAQGHDGRATDGRLVQVKATQGSSVALRSEPQHLIVLRLDRDGSAAEVYNGPGTEPWRVAGKTQSNGQRPVSLSKLRALMPHVPIESRLARRAG